MKWTRNRSARSTSNSGGPASLSSSRAKRLKGNIIHERARSIKRPRPPASSLVRLAEPPLVHTHEGYEGSSSAGGSRRLLPGGAGLVVEGGQHVELSRDEQVDEVPADVRHVPGRRLLDGGAASRQQADDGAAGVVGVGLAARSTPSFCMRRTWWNTALLPAQCVAQGRGRACGPRRDPESTQDLVVGAGQARARTPSQLVVKDAHYGAHAAVVGFLQPRDATPDAYRPTRPDVTCNARRSPRPRCRSYTTTGRRRRRARPRLSPRAPLLAAWGSQPSSGPRPFGASPPSSLCG